MATELTDFSKLCVHTITTKPWAIERSAQEFSKASIVGITVWRDALAGRDIKATGNMLRDLNLEVVSLCRGGFFPSTDKNKRQLAIEDNLKAIDEAEALGTNMVVLVCGADGGNH